MCTFISVHIYNIIVNLSFSLALLSQVKDQTNICPKSLTTFGESVPRIQTTVLSQKEGRGPIEAGVSLVEAWLEGVLLHHQDHHGKEEVGQAHDDNQRTFSFTLLAGKVEASKRDQDLVGKADGQQAPQHAQVDFGCGFRRKQRQVNLKKFRNVKTEYLSFRATFKLYQTLLGNKVVGKIKPRMCARQMRMGKKEKQVRPILTKIVILQSWQRHLLIKLERHTTF